MMIVSKPSLKAVAGITVGPARIVAALKSMLKIICAVNAPKIERGYGRKKGKRKMQFDFFTQKKMRVLVACEYSGKVRDAFAAKGHDAMSCDLLPTDAPGPHYQGDVLDILYDNWDLMIAHPPCTHLAVSGARHFAAKRKSGVQQQALEFVRFLLDAPIPKIALENPVSIISSAIRKPDQIIQPWQFGHGETKATCLWLKNLPLLRPTNIVSGRDDRIHKMPPSPDRWKKRSTTYDGIAIAMADQWGVLC